MNLDISGYRMHSSVISNYQQRLDMKEATLITSFDFQDKASVTTRMMSLRHLPYSAMIIVEVEAKQDIKMTASSVLEAPTHLNDVRNYYSEIDRPHIVIPLMTSVGLSPSNRIKVAGIKLFHF